MAKKAQNNSLQRAIDIVGSQTELARRIGVLQAYVWNWLHRSGGKVPGEYVIPIEKATDGKVSRFELRPDLYPAEDFDELSEGEAWVPGI